MPVILDSLPTYYGSFNRDSAIAASLDYKRTSGRPLEHGNRETKIHFEETPNYILYLLGAGLRVGDKLGDWIDA
jgi:hypothetical protein